MKKVNTKKMITISMMSAIALILMVLEIQIVIFPSFLKIDFSDLPALIGGFAFGPIAAIIIELIKNLLHFILKNDGTGGVGNLANFIVGISFVVPAALIYARTKTRKSAVVGMAVGCAVMAVVSVFTNYFVLIPLYSKIMPIEVIINIANAANKNIVDTKTYIIWAVIPFNLLKAILVSIVAFFVYKPLSRFLK